jgi:two-component system, chemotaxis family, protein-glutamate methylesterase/glutaminase
MAIENVRVLIVDDSAFARFAILRELESAEGITVIDSARDGLEAIEKIKQYRPDVITLDVEMPRLDGLATLERIMAECPTPVVMLSSLTGKGTEATLKALDLGAIDFFLKRSLSNPVGDGNDATDLINKLMAAAKVSPARYKAVAPPPVAASKPKLGSRLVPASTIVVIGSSTGGPKALYQVVPGLPADIPAAVLIVQHMPPGFTHSLAERLDHLSNIRVKEVEPGDVISQGVAYIAKGGYHMVVEKGGTLALNENPTVCGVRPSVDVLMQSVAQFYKKSVLGVILTGMGSDGTRGSQQIKQQGGHIIAEDQSTCVVWGMPKSVAEAGYADQIIPLPRIADGIVRTLAHYKGVERERSGILVSEK